MPTYDYFEVESPLLNSKSASIHGDGAPGSGRADDVLTGSTYTNELNGDLYLKITDGAGAATWRLIATQEYVNGQIGSTISWREPVEVIDDVSTTIPAATTNTVDGQTITVGMRVLFSNQTIATDKNVFVASGSTGAWTWTEATNAETDGDTLYVQSGTNAGKQYTFNGTDWVLSNQSTLDEDGFIRAFIGKDAAGNEMPNYSSNNYVVDGTSLETAIGVLDAQVFTNAGSITTINSDITNLQTEDGFIRAFIGKDTTGNEMPNYSSNAYVVDGTSLEAAIGVLDAQVSSNAGNITTLQVDLLKAQTITTSNNVTTMTVIDSVLVDDVAVVYWKVYARGNLVGDAAKNEAIKYEVSHNGHAAADATDLDRVRGPKLKHPNLIGLQVNVVLTGTGATQKMELQVNSTTAVDVRAIREVIEF